MDEKNTKKRKVIGYWMSEKKSQKLNWWEFARLCRANGDDVVKLDLTRSLEDQGPFNVIIHKLTDIIAQALQNDVQAQTMLNHVESYIHNHPEVVILDPIDNVRKLLDRYTSYRIIHESDLHEIDVFTPTFVELTSNDEILNSKCLKDAGVQFPFVCKPSVANGTDCHKMAIVFNEAGLKDCIPPCVAHTFVNHNAILYKLFIVGDEYHVVERPSVKNLYPNPDRKTIHFNSHAICKPDSTSSLIVLDEDEENIKIMKADETKLKHIVTTLRKELGMNLLGVDLIVENKTGRHGIVDINPYPGYDGYPDFFSSLLRCISTVKNENLNNSCNRISSLPLCQSFSSSSSEQEDSGIETGADSSDEKKKLHTITS